jgi:hypothetical protein
MRLEPLTAAHVAALDPQDAQAHLSAEERLQVSLAQAAHGPSFAALAGELVVAVGGVYTVWPTRGIGWAGLSRHAGPHMLALTRAVRDWYEALGYLRVEMYAAADHPEAVRWARLLGFHNETPIPMRAFLPEGTDAYLFARVFPQ